MSRIHIDEKLILSYEYEKYLNYWKSLSSTITSEYSNKTFTDHIDVENVLSYGFQFFVDRFKEIVLGQKSFSFFLYSHWLHEQSIQVYKKTLAGFEISEISETEFAMYRRILKLILEQGCDIDLIGGKFPLDEEILAFDEIIQELIYLGTWIYQFADHLAFQKMIDECYVVYFDENQLLVIDWQHHYGEAYNQLFPDLKFDYVNATMDEKALPELKETVEKCFKIDFNFACGIIFEIKKHHNPLIPDHQTIQPHILPQNIINAFNGYSAA